MKLRSQKGVVAYKAPTPKTHRQRAANQPQKLSYRILLNGEDLLIPHLVLSRNGKTLEAMTNTIQYHSDADVTAYHITQDANGAAIDIWVDRPVGKSCIERLSGLGAQLTY